jgi:hypothetical protein
MSALKAYNRYSMPNILLEIPFHLGGDIISSQFVSTTRLSKATISFLSSTGLEHLTVPAYT